MVTASVFDHSKNEDTRSWWRTVGVDRPQAARGCWDTDCDHARLESVDIYCHTHERFLPLAGSGEPGRNRPLVANVARLAVCGAFILTAFWDTSFPVLLIAVVAGSAIVALPLRRYAATWRVAITAWAVACCLATTVAVTAPSKPGIVVFAILIVVAVAWLLLLAQTAHHPPQHLLRRASGMRSLTRRSGTGAAIATSGAMTVAAVALRLGLAVTLPSTPAAVTTILGTLAFGGLAGVLGVAVVIGVIEGSGRVGRGPGPLSMPDPPVMVDWRVPQTRWSGSATTAMEHVARASQALLNRVHASTITAGRYGVNALLRVRRLAAVGIVRMANWGYWQLVRIRHSAVAAGQLMRLGAHIGWFAAKRSFRVVVVPCAGMVVAAFLLVVFADAVRGYLVDGGLRSVAVFSGAAAGASALLTAAWVALCRLRLRCALGSAGRSAGICAAHLLLFLAAGGWIVGLPGTFGYGPIRVGWITVGSTLVLGGASIIYVARRRLARRVLDPIGPLPNLGPGR